MTLDLARIRLLAVDVDGVLTDGTLWYGADGEALKGFHVRDGLGLRLVIEAGVEVAVVSARASAALDRRVAELKLRHVHTGREDKWAALEETMAALGIGADQVAFVTDDVLDLPTLRRAGLAVAVADAHPEVRAAAHWITRAPGGRGAVREIADAIVAARVDPGFHVVIPSRYGATRLPGKPLREIAGRPMIAHVWDRAAAAGAASITVATDDARIVDAVAGFGGVAAMTAAEHQSGTERIAEVARQRGWSDDTVVVNLQGDEPAMPSAAIRRAAELLRSRPDAPIATLATPIHTVEDLFDPNVVKVVLDDRELARWFSRAPLPWVRGAFDAGPPAQLPADVSFLRHLGLYAYRVGALQRLVAEPPSAHERAESLEQLRALACGLAIAVGVVDKAPSHGVDSETDLARIQHEFAALTRD